jgi:L-ectoine synthase
MIVRTLQEAEKTDRRVVSENWESTRLSLKDDNMGFSFHITTFYEGKEQKMWYKNHLEAVFCISGEGWIKDLATGEKHTIKPGTIYLLDKHDRHVLHADTEMKLACAFNPPVSGREVHDETGAYPADLD